MLSHENKNPASQTGMLFASKKFAGLHQSHKYYNVACVKSLYCTATWGRDYLFFFLLLATTINFWYGVVRRGRGRMPLREWKTNGKSGCCLDTQSLCYIGVIQLKNCIHLSKKNLSILYNSSPSYKNVWEGTTLKNISIYYFFPVGRN